MAVVYSAQSRLGSLKGAGSRAWAAAFRPPDPGYRPPFGMGHNDGPPLGGRGTLILWQKAVAAAWKDVRPEVARRRMRLAAECGLSYREYTLEILERGRWLDADRDHARIAEIRAARALRNGSPER